MNDKDTLINSLDPWRYKYNHEDSDAFFKGARAAYEKLIKQTNYLDVMYCVIESDYDPLPPIAIFSTKQLAANFISFYTEEAKRAHKRMRFFEIVELYVNPSSLSAIDEEDNRLFEESVNDKN